MGGALVFLVALGLVLAPLAAIPIGFVDPVAAAESSGEILVEDPGAGVPTNHSWTVTGAGGTFEEIHLNYSGTGTNFTAVGVGDVIITKNGSAIGASVTAVTSTEADEVLNVSLDTGELLNETDELAVHVLSDTVRNPESDGTYGATLELHDSLGIFENVLADFTIGESGGTMPNGAVRVEDATALAATNHSWNLTGASATFDVIELNYSYTGTDLGGVKAGNVSVEVVDSEGATTDVGVASATTTDAADEVLNVTLSSAQSITTSDELVVNVTNDTVVNPQKIDSHFGEFTLFDGGSKLLGTYDAFRTTGDGYLTGTVTDAETGNPIANAEVVTFTAADWEFVNYTTTEADGTFTIPILNGTYDLDVNANGYQWQMSEGHTVAGDTASVDVQLTPEPPTGTLEGTIATEDGGSLTNPFVWANDASYAHTNATDAIDGSGGYSLTLPEGTYTVTVESDGYAPAVEQNVEIAAGETTSLGSTLAEPAIINGTVSNESGPIQHVWVDASDGERFFGATTDGNGEFEIAVPDGTYSLVLYANGQVAQENHEVTVTAGETKTVDISAVKTEVLASSLSIADSNVDTENISLQAEVRAGTAFVTLANASGGDGIFQTPDDLSGLGVADDTTLQIDLTLGNYTPSGLLYGIEDVDWSATENQTVENATDVTITGTPAQLEYISKYGLGPLFGGTKSEIQSSWPSGSNDKADASAGNGVFFGLFDMSSVPKDVRNQLNGMTVTTNAQFFTMPSVTENSLEVWVAAPHLTTDGDTHEGFYRAFIPNDQLADWGVENPESDLQALYKGAESSFTVTETADGAWIELDLTYSSGMVSIGTSNSGGGGGGGGSGSYDGRTVDSDQSTGEEDAETDEPAGEDGTDDASDGSDEPDTGDDQGEDESDDGDDAREADGAESEAPSDERGDDGMPGFGFGVTILVLALAAVAGRIRD